MRAPNGVRQARTPTARIAFIDIETAPIIGYSWRTYDTNLIKIKQDWYLLSFAVKWAHEKTTRVYGLPDFPNFKKNKTDDSALAKKLWEVFDSADMIVGQNSDRFDIRKSNTRFLAAGLPPPTPYRTVDTLKIARKNFAFSSNKLGDLAAFLGYTDKLETGGFGLWEKCMDGDFASWRKMKRYNKHDVVITEQVYNSIRPWHGTHPNILSIGGQSPTREACPVCASNNVQSRGWERRLQFEVHRFRCNDCAKFSYGERRKAQGVFLR